MKKKLTQLLATGSVLAAMAFGIYAYGCADGWWGAGYMSMFSPEITVNNKKYEPFFYDDYTTFYNGYNIQSTTELFKEETVQNWAAYLEQYDAKTIEYYLYDKELADILTDVAKAEKLGEELNKRVSKTYTLDFSDRKTENFLAFILLSRDIETYSNQQYDYWNYNNRITLYAEADFVHKKQEAYEKASKKDRFYKNRLWFQVLRAKFYSDDRGSVISFFEKTVKKQPKNSLYYRGLSYLAGAYKSVGNYKKSNALFAQIFDEYEPLMPAALFDYKPLDEQGFKESLEMAATKGNRETLYALQGYYTNEFEAMKNLYRLNPASKHLDFLLSRWVNINEQDINIYTAYATQDMHDIQMVKSTLKRKVHTSQLQWINHVTDEKKMANPYMWNAVAAYFNALVGDYQKSADHLITATKLSENSAQEAQIRSLRLLNNLLGTEQMNKQNEEKLTADVHWLLYDEANMLYDTTGYRTHYLQTFTKKYLSALYKSEGDPLMAELTYPIYGFFKDQNQSVAMEQLLLRNTRTAWQDVFVGTYPYKLADIYESRGIYLFYEDKIEEAIATFEKIPPYEKKEYNWQTKQYEVKKVDYKAELLPGNPFNGKIKDCNDCDHNAYQPTHYSQLDFLKKVKEMQTKIASGQDVYSNALLVANAFYNTSYFGNARRFYYNNVLGEQGSNAVQEANKPILHSMENARRYYELALKHAQNDEQRAKVYYLLAKVERNDFYALHYYSKSYFSPYGDFISFKAWKGFDELQRHYTHTQYYREVINECGYFRKYVGLEQTGE